MRRILVVDDEMDFVLSVKKNLEARGDFQVFECPNSEAALILAKKMKPDVIFLDIMMPGLTGPEVAERLRAQEETEAIPIVFITGVIPEEEAQKKGSLLWGKRFLTKPVSVRRLLEMIEELLA